MRVKLEASFMRCHELEARDGTCWSEFSTRDFHAVSFQMAKASIKALQTKRATVTHRSLSNINITL